MQAKHVTTSIAALVLLTVSAGCAPHSFWNLKSRYDVSDMSGVSVRPSTNRKVFVTTETLDRGSYDFVAQLDVTRVWYGSKSGALEALADMARKVGADAVIESRVWFKPAGWAWAAPQASGKAVVIKQPERADLNRIKGEYR